MGIGYVIRMLSFLSPVFLHCLVLFCITEVPFAPIRTCRLYPHLRCMEQELRWHMLSPPPCLSLSLSHSRMRKMGVSCLHCTGYGYGVSTGGHGFGLGLGLEFGCYDAYEGYRRVSPCLFFFFLFRVSWGFAFAQVHCLCIVVFVCLCWLGRLVAV
ncbi:hypothetical protein K491DRAFT_348886 [Lophiostoma macrostomum CBS 122681]|uniref:Uncharacterized protein n=1 Tax=Lophiostoma macrostomum CBS 122681 TaxID=1314788 RepID=A0A6A6TDU6_9PLEO|nr:hypothetical protein K491DRAFT_348886 [Lophiostoma macrostomum CBS 122681]